MKRLHCWLLLPAICFVSACGREERAEAVRFSKILEQKKSDFGGANAQEQEFVDGVKSWCGSIMANGAGRGEQLDQNAAVANDLAKSAATISAQVGQVRQAVTDEALKKEYVREVRSNMLDQLSKRQRFLQDVRALLLESAPVFVEFRKNKDYKGDSYPAGIGKLNDALQSYKGPNDAVGKAMTDLKAKYDISEADLKM